MDSFNKLEESTKPLTIIGNYKLQRTLGTGGTGEVKLAINQKTGEKVAVKIVKRAHSQLNEKDENPTEKEQREKEKLREVRAIREARIMKSLSHPNIVQLRGLTAIDSHIYILMDYVNGGQLLNYIIKRKKLSENQACYFSRQIVSALDYIHHNSIVHRDLKIENILIDKKGENIKVIDFGLSNLFFPERRLTTFCGSLYFAAPELLLATPYKGPEVDIWSLGVVIYMMVTGSVPFDDESMVNLHEKIMSGKVAYPSHLSLDCQDLLSRIFVINPNQRIILADLIRHPWMNHGFEKIIENHLPLRLPLTLPMSSDVLEKMANNFNIGSISSIRSKLEKIILSPTYQMAADHVSKIQYAQMKGKWESTFTKYMMNRWGSNTDPQSVPEAYHPFISLYYLTRENILGTSETVCSIPQCDFIGEIYSTISLTTETCTSNSLEAIETIEFENLDRSTQDMTYLDYPYDDCLSHSSSFVDTPLNTPTLSGFKLDLPNESHTSKLNLRSLASKIASLLNRSSKK